MCNSYPSRRELRQQREREERATLRDQEAQRYAEEVEDREQRAAEAQQQAAETLANAEPVPANQTVEASSNTDGSDDEEDSSADGPLETDQPAEDHDGDGTGRRAAASPVDAPADVEASDEAPVVPRRRRRADSQVTATGMLPLITKRRDEHDESKPKSRREAREQAAREAAERAAEVEALQAQHAQQQEAVLPKPVRRATAPQAPPPPIPAVTDAPVEGDQPVADDEVFEDPENTVVVSTSDLYGESAVEITDMTGLDTLEIRRAELRTETEKLTQEIIELGQENPNVIDPLLLRRQKELAEKSQELQDLETAAIAIVEEHEQDDDTSKDQYDAEVAPELPDDVSLEPASEGGEATDDKASAEADVASESVPDSVHNDEGTKPARRARRASSGPIITGPFEVAEDEENSVEAALAETKPDFATHFESQTETDTIPTTGPEQPLEASSAHGLDTLDPKESEAPERRILTISVIVFAIGILALIVALILLTR